MAASINDYFALSDAEKTLFINEVNKNMENSKSSMSYVRKIRKRITKGTLQPKTHQVAGRLVMVDELERADIKDRKTYYLCLCDCGKWHICRDDAFKKETSNGGCHSCGCLNKESYQKTLFDSEIQAKRINNLKDYLSDKGVQIEDSIYNWQITQVKIKTTEDGRRRKFVKGICPYCKEESHWIRADGIANGTVHSCGCASESIGEQRIRLILKKNNIPFVQEYVNPHCFSSESGKYYRWDFYVNNNYLIEFDGRQHFQSDNCWFPPEKVQEIQKRDKEKNKWAFDNKIPLIRIPYTPYQFH